jgi:hypothetical protein
MSNCYRYTPTHVRGHNRAVYDSLHAPSRQIRSRTCVLQVPIPGGMNQFESAAACDASDACMMGYVCGADKVEHSDGVGVHPNVPGDQGNETPFLL